ncbi:MAG: PDZ domain-containing protein, partial [Pirellulales bacterium]|nr:PDZ domain-containing protein [Pirellulales bacterium]
MQLQTVGGLDRDGSNLLGSGPTTGTVVSADGYIVSSAYNFIQKPASILATLPDGRRLPARLVARDHSRMLVLLKVDASDLAVPVATPKSSVRVGQWAIAVGRSFDAKQTNVSVGIVSAVDRIWGKAIQTDAKVSPNNYGGPLVDIRGRVLGILVPLNPQQTGVTSGAEWYDGGIGFAVPLEDILKVLPRWTKGEDLHAGQLGITLEGGRDLFGKQPTIASTRPRSLAADAGLQKGDRVVAIDDTAVETLAQMRHALAPRYAGETVRITVVRDKQRKTVSVPLVAKLEPYTPPFLGILPDRSKGRTRIRFVYPDSPAARAGLSKGDELLAVDDEEVADVDQLRRALSDRAPGDAVSLTLNRNGKSLTVRATLGTISEKIPATSPIPTDASSEKAIGLVELKLPEFANECSV